MVIPIRLISRPMLAYLLLFLICQFLPSAVLAQAQGSGQTPAPNPAIAAPVDSSQAGAGGQTERISIRIEFPLVEPMFDVFYPREEPRIEADAIAPITNPLLELPPTIEKLPQESPRADRIIKPQSLLDRMRE
jgi:hypothetical protein